MKRILIAAAMILGIWILNFCLFLYSYKKLAFPYMPEAQRMENAPIIFTYVLIGFLIIAIFSMATARYLFNKNS